jgi:hypothetical protein
MFTRQDFQITQPAGLDQILRLPTSKSVVLELPSLRSDETEGWQREINALLRKTCGCGEATAALLMVMAALLVGVYVFWNTVKGSPFLSIAIGLGCFISSIAIGKAFGKWRGRRRLATSIRRLHAILMQRALDHGAASRIMAKTLEGNL